MRFVLFLFPFVFGLVSCVSSSVENVTSSQSGHKIERNPEYKLKFARYVVADKESTKVKISLWDQKAWLLNKHGKVLLVTDISTGIDGRKTPKGKYTVLEKLEEKRSNLYGRLVHKETRKVVVEKAWEHEGAIPAELEYEGIMMPYWMRLTWDGIGMHVGKFPRHVRTSFGCIRVYKKAQPYLFKKVIVGTPVEIIEESLVREMHGG